MCDERPGLAEGGGRTKTPVLTPRMGEARKGPRLPTVPGGGWNTMATVRMQGEVGARIVSFLLPGSSVTKWE